MQRLQDAKVNIFRTDLNGSIIVTTDGVNYTVTPEKVSTEIAVVSKTYEPEEGAEDSGNQFVQSKKININTATASELVSLKDLSAFKAQMIVKYRTKYGKFATVDDLVKVPGINKAVIEKIKDQITTQ